MGERGDPFFIIIRRNFKIRGFYPLLLTPKIGRAVSGAKDFLT